MIKINRSMRNTYKELYIKVFSLVAKTVREPKLILISSFAKTVD
jgi:hypothetical protein